MVKIYIVIIVIIFILGLLFTITNETKVQKELFSNKGTKGNKYFKNNKGFKCPNILIKKGKYIYLYDSKLASIPGVNPVRFNSLEDYVEYVQWQRSQGINCPLLFLQNTYDIQGNHVYKLRPSPTDLQGGLQEETSMDAILGPQSLLVDAARNDPPYNKNSYPGFDPLNQYIGLVTPLDKIYHENPHGVSPNPMDSNWGGANYTQALVKKGYYKDDNVKIMV